MGCNCKDHAEDIERGRAVLDAVRALFIQRMTVDSDHHDRRRKGYNQAIFRVESNEDVDQWNAECKEWGLPPKKYGRTYQVWSEMDMDMVLRCFDDAVKDWRRSWCDVENCRRK